MIGAENELMTLEEQDKDWIRLTCSALVREVLRELLNSHISACPYGKVIQYSKGMILGMIIGTGLLGGGLGAAIMKHFMTG